MVIDIIKPRDWPVFRAYSETQLSMYPIMDGYIEPELMENEPTPRGGKKRDKARCKRQRQARRRNR